MKNEAVYREKSKLSNGREMPIECLNRRVKRSPHNSKENPHFHKYIEFLFGLDSCDVTVWIEGDRVSLREGDMLIIHSDVLHSFFHKNEINNYICVKILPELIFFSENFDYDSGYVLPFLQKQSLPYRFFSRDTLKDSGISETFAELMREWNSKEYGYEIAVKSAFLKIFLWTVRYRQRCGEEIDAQGEGSYAESLSLIRMSLAFINKNYADITESDAAAHVNLSYSYYSRMFKRAIGKSFNEYINAVRINAAERHLLSTDMTVTDIALATGFGTSSYFIDKFRKAKGCTPRQYRMRGGGV